MAKKILIGCVVLAAFFVVAVVVLFVWFASSSTPRDIEVAVDAPTMVRAGEEFKIVLRLTNAAAKPQTLVDLDIADSYLDGIVIRSAQPSFSGSDHITRDESVSYSFDLKVPARGEATLTLNALAAHPGDFAGDFDFCINNSFSFVTQRVRTIVREPAEPGRE